MYLYSSVCICVYLWQKNIMFSIFFVVYFFISLLNALTKPKKIAKLVLAWIKTG